MKPEGIYLDHSAATYLDPKVKQAMEPYGDLEYANPSSLHSLGKKAKEALNQARNNAASLLNAKPSEIIFTAGGTESINLAIFGVVGANDAHIITSNVEHHAVLSSCKLLETKGCKISYLPADKEGFISLEQLKKAVKPETTLISIMYANNEIGTIEPIKEISAWLKILNQQRISVGLGKILFHTDACQAGGFLNIDIIDIGVDLMTLNGSKIYGPKQTGILFVKKGIELNPLIYGGGQERNLRSGTENIPGIIGFTKALELVQKDRLNENDRLQKLRNYVISQICNKIPDVIINGPKDYSILPNKIKRLPNNINVSFKKVDGNLLLAYLDKRGIYVSTGSACSSKGNEPSHVLMSINCSENYINGSLRMTLGKRNTKEDLDYLIKILVSGVKEIRQISMITTDLEKIKGTPLDAGCIKMTSTKF